MVDLMSRTAAFFGDPLLGEVRKMNPPRFGWPNMEYQDDDKSGMGKEHSGPPEQPQRSVEHDRGEVPPPPPPKKKRKEQQVHTQQPQKSPQNAGTQGKSPAVAAGDRNQLDNSIQRKKPSSRQPNHSWWT